MALTLDGGGDSLPASPEQLAKAPMNLIGNAVSLRTLSDSFLDDLRRFFRQTPGAPAMTRKRVAVAAVSARCRALSLEAFVETHCETLHNFGFQSLVDDLVRNRDTIADVSRKAFALLGSV